MRTGSTDGLCSAEAGNWQYTAGDCFLVNIGLRVWQIIVIALASTLLVITLLWCWVWRRRQHADSVREIQGSDEPVPVITFPPIVLPAPTDVEDVSISHLPANMSLFAPRGFSNSQAGEYAPMTPRSEKAGDDDDQLYAPDHHGLETSDQQGHQLEMVGQRSDAYGPV